MKFKTLLSIGLIFLIINTSEAFADCSRHLYSSATQPWTVTFTGSNSSSYTVNPGDQIAVSFSPLSDPPGYYGNVTVTDYMGNTCTYNYYSSGSCIEIHHSGDTGSVIVNSDADGDITFDGDSGCSGSTSRISKSK